MQRSHRCVGVCEPSTINVPVHQCRVSKEEMWKVYDVFFDINESQSGSATRAEYFAFIGKTPTVLGLRVQRRARLGDRFRDSASPVSVVEFMRLFWRNLNDADITEMTEWARLRQAYLTLLKPGFKASDTEMDRIFTNLDKNGDHTIKASALVEAGILSGSEVFGLLKHRRTNGAPTATIDRLIYKSVICPFLREKYVHPDVLAKLRDEEMNLNQSLQHAFVNAAK